MNIKQITDEAEKSITEDMQKAIDAKDQWQAEMFFNWAVGTLNFWRRLASFIVRQESDLSKWNEVNKYRDDALEKFEELVSMDRVHFFKVRYTCVLEQRPRLRPSTLLVKSPRHIERSGNSAYNWKTQLKIFGTNIDPAI